MIKGKFWLYQIIMVAIVSLVLSSPALADKPTDKKDNGKTTTSSNNGKGKGSGSDSGTTDGGSTDGGTDSGYPCPVGEIYWPYFDTCIPG